MTDVGIEMRIVGGKRRIVRIGRFEWRPDGPHVRDWAVYDPERDDWTIAPDAPCCSLDAMLAVATVRAVPADVHCDPRLAGRRRCPAQGPRARLSHRRRAGLLERAERRMAAYVSGPHARLSLLLESARAGIGPAAFLGLSALLAAAGGAAGALAIQTVKGAAIAAVLLGGLPYIIIRMTLTHRQMQSRIDFLPAVELFYQSYLSTGGRQVRIALGRMVEERRLAGPLLPVFEQLVHQPVGQRRRRSEPAGLLVRPWAMSGRTISRTCSGSR